MNNPDLYIRIRTKKLGLLLYDARIASGKSLQESANLSGISEDRITAVENGLKAPSLPEIEILAFLYKQPLEHFWGDKILSQSEEENQTAKFQQLMIIRHRMIGTNIKNILQEKQISEDIFAEKIGVDTTDFSAFLFGEKEIPIPTLEIIAKGLECRIEDFFDTHGIIGQWRSGLLTAQKMKEMPEDLRDFVSKPINVPFIELAIRLSELNVNRLRSVAEGLLEITL